MEAAFRLEAEVPKRTETARQGGVIGHDHAALSRGDQLVRVETEATHRAHGAAAHPRGSIMEVLRSVGFCGIFDHRQPVLIRQRQDRVHVHRMSVDVHRHDRAGTRGDLGFECTGVKAPRDRIAVNQNRHAPGRHHGDRTRDDRERGKDDLVSGRKIQRSDRDL